MLIASCSHMRSGQYIKISPGDTLAKLSKEFNVPEWAIEAANPKKKIVEGAWIFVPLNWGFVNASRKNPFIRGPAAVKAYLRSEEFSWPVPASKKVSSPFGKRWGRKHTGIDIAARRGSYIVAANDGVVVYSGKLGGYGYITVIAHKFNFFTIYAHAMRNFTQKDEKVYRGQVIAKVGNTGRSTGPHLHFEIRHNGDAIDPLDYLQR